MAAPISPMRRAGAALGSLVLVVVTIGCVAWIAPAAFGLERYVITGGSMSGTFEVGSVVFTRDQPVADLAVGDVVTYMPPAEAGSQDLVTHRIVAARDGRGEGRIFRTQGDANPDPDPWRFRLEADTQPVVVGSVPHAGHLLIALADPDVRRIVIGLPAALIALLAGRDLVGALRRTPPRGVVSPAGGEPFAPRVTA